MNWNCNWIYALTIVMSVAFVTPAFALKPVTCAERLMAQGTPPGLPEAYAKLRKLGLRALLAEVDQNKVSVSVRRQWLPWHQPVGARIGWTGSKEIVLRGDINISTPARQEKFLWDVATALFQLQMQPWFWSRSAMLPRAEFPGLDALMMDPGEYLARYMPKVWRDQYLARAKTLLGELYIVFLSMRELQAGDVMPAQDPGRKWMLHAVIMGDGSQAIGPNLEDLETLKRQGMRQLQENVNTRNSRSVLFNYYMAHLKRAMIITSTLTSVVLLPQLATYSETAKQISASEQRLDAAPARALETENKTIAHRRQREIALLQDAIKLEQEKPAPDEQRLIQLKTQLQTRLERSPGGIYATPRE